MLKVRISNLKGKLGRKYTIVVGAAVFSIGAIIQASKLFLIFSVACIVIIPFYFCSCDDMRFRQRFILEVCIKCTWVDSSVDFQLAFLQRRFPCIRLLTVSCEVRLYLKCRTLTIFNFWSEKGEVAPKHMRGKIVAMFVNVVTFSFSIIDNIDPWSLWWTCIHQRNIRVYCSFIIWVDCYLDVGISWA